MKPVPTATLAQLVNQFREKFEGPNVARTCVLIGERAEALRIIREGCDIDALEYQQRVREDRALP